MNIVFGTVCLKIFLRTVNQENYLFRIFLPVFQDVSYGVLNTMWQCLTTYNELWSRQKERESGNITDNLSGRETSHTILMSQWYDERKDIDSDRSNRTLSAFIKSSNSFVFVIVEGSELRGEASNGILNIKFYIIIKMTDFWG